VFKHIYQVGINTAVFILFQRKLEENNLVAEFKKLTPYRQKEILRHMGFLKTKKSLLQNIAKVIQALKKGNNS
jgi:uncharacterized protein YdeI (YjbR/CyaY-like superfamily)